MEAGDIVTRYAVVDIETTGSNPKNGDEIIEIGIVVLEDERIIEEFSSYINPGKDIPPFITNLTGITNEDVQDAPSFGEMANKVIALCKDSYFVAHHVQFDLVFLNETLIREGFQPIKGKIIDTVELARIMTPMGSGFKLTQLAEHYHIYHKRPHRALSDAFVTGQLLIKLLNRAKSLPAKTLEQLLRLESNFNSDLYDILSKFLEEKRYSLQMDDQWDYYQGLAIKKIQDDVQESSSELTPFDTFLTDIIGERGTLSKLIPDYENRIGQQEMAETIFHAFQERNHGVIEAETGTGKTIAYLIPSIYQSLKTGKRVLISTYTTQLQSQAFEKEIPLLQKAIPYPFSSVVIKGRSHYLSLRLFLEELSKPIEEDNYDITLTKACILVWLTETDTGDRDELHLPSSGNIFWRKINAEAEEELSPKSSWYSKNFYVRVRQKAQIANIIITNHALLCTEMASENPILPSYDYCVIDEAHHLDKVASNQFGVQLSYVGVQYVLNEIKVELAYEAMMEQLLEAKELADDLFRYIFSIVNKKQMTSFNDVGRIQLIFHGNEWDTKTITSLHDLANRFLFKLKDIIVYCEQRMEEEAIADNNDGKEEYKAAIKHLEAIWAKLHFFLFDKGKEFVKWIEIEAQGARNAVYLYCEPLAVHASLKEKLFSKKNSVILTSATLTTNNTFEYILQKVGLEDIPVITKQIQSPFKMEEQVKLLIPNDLPHLKYQSEEDFITAISYSIYELAKITKGRMLVLFTSYFMLKKTYEMLISLTDQDDFVLIAQGITSGSRERLKKNFQSFDQAILLGTSSFWEGIDIPGEDLSAVVIVRLPFEPPNHPVYFAKAEALKKEKKNPFMELALPNAVIRFKQGFGRLIRSNKDKGIIFVCDVRLMKSSYGHYFLQSIPKVPVVFDESEELFHIATEWFQNE